MDALPFRAPWYVAGPLIGLIVTLLLWVINRPLGALGGYTELAEWAGGRRPRPDRRVYFTFGIVARGLLSALAGGGWHATLALPGYVEVWPGAFAGSVCGRRLSGEAATTIGFERRFNTAFRIEGRGAFMRVMLADTPPKPPHADQIRASNLYGLLEQTAPIHR
jgi:hypothetical protein